MRFYDIVRKTLDSVVAKSLQKDKLLLTAQQDIVDLRTAIGLLMYLIPEDTDTQFAVDILTVTNSTLERTQHYDNSLVFVTG